jgi:hypothetical protein
MYWDRMGKENTEGTAKLALEAAKKNNIKHIVVASNSGSTAELFAGKGIDIVCVTHAYGFREPGKNEMEDEARQKLIDKGIRVMTATHVLSGVERAFSTKFGGINPVEIMAYSLRMLSQGVKVGVEISTMALDAGFIPHGESIITVAGTGRGADTAMIIKPAHAKEILEARIEEIICKPR